VSLRFRPQVQALSRRFAASERLSPDIPRPVVHVVAAAVIDADGRVLIAQRPEGTHLAGGWEFPGGKLEPGEDRAAGLARELREEIGIAIATPRPLIRVRHVYPSREVLLDTWVVTRYGGEPHGLEGQALRWCTQDELATVELLPADGPIVRALRLPERLTQVSSRDYTVQATQSSGNRRAATAIDDHRLHGVFCTNADEAIGLARSGADFLVMRHAVGPDDLEGLCRLVSVPVFARGLELEEAWASGASGLNEITESK
jgi:mutator protein MutT